MRTSIPSRRGWRLRPFVATGPESLPPRAGPRSASRRHLAQTAASFRTRWLGPDRARPKRSRPPRQNPSYCANRCYCPMQYCLYCACIGDDVECARPGKGRERRLSLQVGGEALRIEFLPTIRNNYRAARDVAVRENTDMTHVSEVATLLRKLADYSRLPLAEAKKRAADDRLQQAPHPVMRSSSAHGKRQNSEK